MKKSELYNFTFQILSIYLIIHTTINLPFSIVFVHKIFKINSNNDSELNYLLIIIFTVPFVLQYFIYYLILIKSNYITQKLIRPENDTTININVNKKSAIQVVLLFIAGLTIFTNLSRIDKILEEIHSIIDTGMIGLLWFLIKSLDTILAIFIMLKSDSISKFIENIGNKTP